MKFGVRVVAAVIVVAFGLPTIYAEAVGKGPVKKLKTERADCDLPCTDACNNSEFCIIATPECRCNCAMLVEGRMKSCSDDPGVNVGYGSY